MLTRGGTAKSTSRYAVPSFMVLWIRLAVAALVISAETNTPPLVAFAAMAFTFWTSAFPLDFSRSRAFWQKSPRHLKCRDLIAHLFENGQSVANLLRKGIELSQQPALGVGEVG